MLYLHTWWLSPTATCKINCNENAWSQGHGSPPSPSPVSHHQRTREPTITLSSIPPPEDTGRPKDQCISPNPAQRGPRRKVSGRLLAAGRKKSGAWLNALPVPSLGLCTEDETTRVAVGLRLGTPLCRPHECSNYGATVDGLVTHGLSCRWSEGRHPRHTAVNTIPHRSLSSAKIPSRMEPPGLYRSDGSTLTGAPICPGNAERCSYGRLCAQTPSRPHTFHLLREGLKWWLPRQNGSKMPSTPTLFPATILCGSWWRLLGSWGRQQRTSYGT